MVETIARELDPRLVVLGIVGGKASSDYVEILLGVDGCDVEPCRLTVGVSRLASSEEIRLAIEQPLKVSAVT